MDYEVFLMSRIHEEYSKTRNNEHSIKVGIKESGPVVVAAALIMFSVFIAFVFQDDVMIKSMGIALGFGVLFDAFVVRLLLVPALTQLFGKASWYMPSWLNRILPNVDIEGHALQEHKQSASKSNSTETYNRSFHIAGHQQSVSANANNTLHVDNATKEIYNNIAQQTQNSHFLYEALKQYQSQQTTTANVKQPDPNNTSDEALLQLLQQQSDNIKQLNEIIEQVIEQQNRK